MKRKLRVFSIIASVFLFSTGVALFLYLRSADVQKTREEMEAHTSVHRVIGGSYAPDTASSRGLAEQCAQKVGPLVEVHPSELAGALWRENIEGEQEYIDAQFGDERSMRFDSHSGRLIRYLNPMKFVQVPEGMTIADRISEKRAREVARRLIVAAGVEEELLDNTTERSQYLSLIGDSLQGAAWLYAIFYRWHDIPVMGGVSVQVSAYDGSIVHFTNANFTPPKDTTPRITSGQAIDTASALLEEGGISVTGNGSAELFFAQGNSGLDENRPLEHASEFSLCWLVQFANKESGGELPVTTVVNAIDGKPIGMVR